MPTFNIFIYNVFGSKSNNASKSGDQLYGVEPSRYYVRNLLLTMGPAWILVIIAPIILIFDSFLNMFYDDIFLKSIIYFFDILSIIWGGLAVR